MYRFKRPQLLLLLGLIAPVYSYAADFCIAVGGGFGGGGTSFIAIDFTLPAAGICTPWAGFTKTATSVILITSGTACTSSSGSVLTVSVSSADPENLGAGKLGSDYIQLCRNGGTDCAASAGSDQGAFAGSPAEKQACTAALLKLPPTHD
jgi:hypothetical protein